MGAVVFLRMALAVVVAAWAGIPSTPSQRPGAVGSQPVGDPVVAAAGDIACDPGSTNFNDGLGTGSRCMQLATSELLVGGELTAVLALGDNQYVNGRLSKFRHSYDPSWGRVVGITHPVAGNHEYGTSDARGHFAYFGEASGSPGLGYYSFDVGAWHLIALNSNCSAVSCDPGSAQETWLRSDLAAHANQCVLAYWHHPRFSSGFHGSDRSVRAFWRALYAAGADVVLAAHDHDYERFAPQTPSGALDEERGIREFVVGTGGAQHYSVGSPIRRSEVLSSGTFGVLHLTLHASGYEWAFVPVADGTFTDSGTSSCH